MFFWIKLLCFFKCLVLFGWKTAFETDRRFQGIILPLLNDKSNLNLEMIFGIESQ